MQRSDKEDHGVSGEFEEKSAKGGEAKGDFKEFKRDLKMFQIEMKSGVVNVVETWFMAQILQMEENMPQE